MIALPSTQRRSRFVFDFQPSRALGAAEWDLDAVTGQPATLVRAATALGRGSDGRWFRVASGVPAFDWGTLDYDDSTVSVGLRLNGDALSFPFLITPRAITVYVRLQKQDAPGASAVLLAIGGATGARLVIAENTTGSYTATYNDGTTSFTSSVTRPIYDDAGIELRCVLQSSGVQLFMSLLGDTEETGTASAALTFPAAWSSATLYLGATTAAANPVNTTFVRVAFGLGALAVGVFRPAFRTLAAAPVTLALAATGQPDEYAFVQGGTVAREMVDVVGDGNYTIVAIGTSPAQPRVTGRRVGSGSTVLLY